MKKHILFFLIFFSIFSNAQQDYVDRVFGLKNTLEKNELRIYVSNSIILSSAKVFVLKQLEKGKWKAKLYTESGKDKIYSKNFKIKNAELFWNKLQENKPKTDTTSTATLYLDPDGFDVYWNTLGELKKYSFEEPKDPRNKNDSKMKTVYHFFEIIENKYGFKFKN
ncbi:hypothetical protein [Halpernia frigidisoli]|uniref:Uncharacterized protein n=1 Tax=Halpernia frigidisoli TaxID=1125876 RepID=A0A1I3J6P1_9FLAO|nr:hypothetical protein [Halpernia frigidisoli]SFI55849.1 hypothetical protein SAMN05443292_2959 [Halpernia frigidisoli]